METALYMIPKMVRENSKALVLWWVNLLQFILEAESHTEWHIPEMRYSKRNTEDNNEPLRYPKNHEITSEQLKQFDEYYKCLNETKVKPEAHYVLAGTSVSLNCNACVSPQGKSIFWRYANTGTNFTENLLHSDGLVNIHSETLKSTQSQNGLSLTLYGLSPAESGHYTCFQDGNVVTPHLVQVANSTEILSKVKPDSAPKGPYSTPPFNLTNLGIKVWFKWSEWSTCSRCGRVGKRIRTGICMVTSLSNNSASGDGVLQLFPDGIPCKSNLLPITLQKNSKIQTTKNEYMVGFCKEKCLERKSYVLKDTAGMLLKKMSNLNESKILIDKLPHVLPPVKHSFLHFNQWDTAHIQCPGNDHTNAPVYWRLGVNLILAENERVHLTPTHILVIDDLSASDSNVYSCWQRNRLVGVVRLTVSQPIRLSFQEQLNAVLLTTIIISFVIICLRILRAYLKRRGLANKSKK